jgi:ABC-type sugar transport system ATPase subunit
MGKQEGNTPLLQMRHIDKSFPGVHALRQVSLDLARGEVLALVGENGAGKSTLIKILAGAHVPDAGEILLDGRAARMHNPHAAQQQGVSVIYQEFNLIPDLTVRENIFLGRERTRGGVIRAAWESSEAAALFARLGLNIDPQARCRELTVSQQQAVEIAKALSLRADILVMDEPTAALTRSEVERLFETIRELKRDALGIIYISHRLDEVFTIADRVMVLRDGRQVATAATADVSRESLIEMMVGRKLEAEFPRRQATLGSERLRVEALRRGDCVKDVSFHVRAGEVLGFAGLAGAGRTETLRLVFGADRAHAGRILIDGVPLRIRHPRDAIAHGICLLTEDRKHQGLILKHSVRENFGLPNLDRYHWGPFVDQRRERRSVADHVDRLKIRVASHEQLVGNLSGGNQQKVVLAKWLARDAKILIFDEPTRGIDVGAKYEIYLLINQLAAAGKAIIMISSELSELLGMCDRILVMREGRLTGEITDVAHATQEDVLSLAIT